ncbi:LysR family transcriptional regulator [Kribbella sandramycini]|uniref:DNA-binding transcriptional LysR family regulator n=1 Tax=Kribbella sandramycini TaxID=60450 RepID=A0A7Y4L1D2_9ACTN|nr:LysR family transcriptional regulator [Kribbella sandramycini]MBB6565207.1 DNA-binding transcriptional LysR family regulator [Kribbella sandramycini]NOL41476.1 LysR family transcriptional regulator [Kribbella sandramycini]
MELRQLRSFVVVAEELNVGRAAVQLHLTQPSLSRQIAALERDLGVELFARVKKRFVLTAAGETFLAEARELLRRSEEAVRAAQRTQRGELGTLRLRFVQSATFEALPRLLGAFRAAYPEVVLDLETLTTLRQTEELLDGRADVGLLRPSAPAVGASSTTVVRMAPGLDSRVVSSDPLMVALPARHRFARRKRLRLEELADEPFVFYNRPSGPVVHDTIVGFCRAVGFTPRIEQQAADVQTIVSLVAAGIGVSLLIGPTPPSNPDAVVYRELSDDLPPWQLSVAWSPDNRSPVLARFLDLL